MAAEDDKLFTATLADLARLQNELRGLLAARWELARFEATVAFDQLKRLAIAFAAALLCFVVALPVAIVAAADMLDGRWGIDRTGWLWIAFATLIVVASAVAWAAYQRFRRRFVGFEETLEVLREDREWIETLRK